MFVPCKIVFAGMRVDKRGAVKQKYGLHTLVANKNLQYTIDVYYIRRVNVTYDL